MTQIRNNPGMSSYFGGGHRGYGAYQWNIKAYAFNSDDEIEAARTWAFGDYTGKGFEGINELLGRKVTASIQGRSGGWLVIDTVLTDDELAKVDAHVKSCMEGLADFLKEEREFRASEEAEANRRVTELTEKLNSDPRVRKLKALTKKIAGDDAVVILKGVRIV